MNSSRRIYLGMPGYGKQTGNAGRGFWRACADMSQVVNDYRNGSLLASNFNKLWCGALNEVHQGGRVDYFAMIHDDIGPEDFWLDKLIDELEAKQLDILGVAVPIKDGRGITSLALHNGPVAKSEDEFYLWLESCGVEHSSLNIEEVSRLQSAYAALVQREYDWRPFCRLSMHDIYQLPETFTSDDVGKPLLLNTGLWVCKFDLSWARQVHFEVNDRIAFDDKRDMYHAQDEPEDWYFSRQCHELGLKIGATRKVGVSHRGEIDFGNTQPWGRNAWDTEYTDKSPVANALPHDIPGWLNPEEGRELSRLAEGKHVLEIGSYCGLSTVCLARTAEHVTAMDWWDGRATPHPRNTLPLFREAIKRHGVSHKVVACTPDSELPHTQYDLVFIDGAHDYESVQADIFKALEVLTPDGVIAFHDYRKTPGESDGRWDEGVTRAVDNFILDGAELISRTGTLAIVRPPAHLLAEV